MNSPLGAFGITFPCWLGHTASPRMLCQRDNCRTMALTFFSVTDPFAKPGNNTQVFGINATGQIVGFYTDSLNKTHGFLYTAGTYVTLDVPGAISTEALGINSSGQIVGIFV